MNKFLGGVTASIWSVLALLTITGAYEPSTTMIGITYFMVAIIIILECVRE